MSKTKPHWITTGWRPALAWSYVLICLFDFIIGPTIYNVLQFYNPGQDVGRWQAITLQGGGLYHLSMGAIIGISTHGRTQEKIKGTVEPIADPIPSFGGSMMGLPVQTAPAPASTYQWAAATPVPAAPVTTGKFGTAPTQPEQPLL